MSPVSFSTGPLRELDSYADLEVPPVTRCTTCLRFDCDGCQREVERRLLAWEASRGRTLVRVWRTARQSITAARVSCLDAEPARVGSALAFGLLAEFLASVSIAVAFLLLLLVVFPSGAWFLLGEPTALLSLLGLGGGLAVFMVFVHALWGVGLEVALACSGAGLRLRRGLAFTFYACGWDLLTSPIGVVLSVGQSGLLRGVDQVREAARVPRPALVRYITVSRGAPRARVAGIVRASFVLPAVATLGVITALFAAWFLA